MSYASHAAPIARVPTFPHGTLGSWLNKIYTTAKHVHLVTLHYAKELIFSALKDESSSAVKEGLDSAEGYLKAQLILSEGQGMPSLVGLS